MNPSTDALLDLQVIDRQRLTLKLAREQRHGKLVEAQKNLAAAEAAAAAVAAEIEKMGALTRQYTANVERCDATIVELRGKQMNAKTNKEYMAIINGVEAARVEKNLREQSLKELGEKLAVHQDKAAKAAEAVAKAKAKLDEVAKEASDSAKPGPEEAALQQQYDERKAKVDPKFLETYERLVSAKHKMPLMPVDSITRSTPFGKVISHNQIEQIRMGKLVIDSGSNAILYVNERGKPPSADAKDAKKG